MTEHFVNVFKHKIYPHSI